MKTIKSSEVKNNFGELSDKVKYLGESFLVEKYGKPILKIVPLTQESDDSKPAIGAKR